MEEKKTRLPSNCRLAWNIQWKFELREIKKDTDSENTEQYNSPSISPAIQLAFENTIYSNANDNRHGRREYAYAWFGNLRPWQNSVCYFKLCLRSHKSFFVQFFFETLTECTIFNNFIVFVLIHHKIKWKMSIHYFSESVIRNRITFP